MLKLIYILLGINALSFQSKNDSTLYPKLKSEELLKTIIKDFKPIKVLNYDDARIVMYREIYNENESINCVYSNYKLPISSKAKNPIFELMRFNILKSIITEHAYPRSKGAREGLGKSDMHHLFPAKLGINIARRNYPFGEINDKEVHTWFKGTKKRRKRPIEEEHNYSKKGDNIFEPKDSFKGNIARALFYFYTMYRNEAIEADASFFEDQRETLLKWHFADPVDKKELKRTYQIATHQSGKPNPFVLDSTLAIRLYDY